MMQRERLVVFRCDELTRRYFRNQDIFRVLKKKKKKRQKLDFLLKLGILISKSTTLTASTARNAATLSDKKASDIP